MAQRLVDEQAEKLVQKAVKQALGGNSRIMRSLLDRLLPARRSAPVSITLPPLETPADLQRATAALVAAVASGELTPQEGEAVARVLSAHRDAIATEQLQRELEELRERLEQSERERKLEERLR